jgi:hypothetical protein
MLSVARTSVNVKRKVGVWSRHKFQSEFRMAGYSQGTNNERRSQQSHSADASRLEKRIQNFLQHHWQANSSGFLFVNRNENTYALRKAVE